MSEYRSELPEVPQRMRRLPIARGYPVPWFVMKVNGEFDFRVQDHRKRILAVNNHLCWLCGQRLGQHLAFVIGPMCAINRVSGEPPSHRECAEFAVKGCPFLTQRETGYREAGLPEGVVMSDLNIVRQPGVALIWVTRSYKIVRVDGETGYVCRMGDPDAVLWFREGRAATRAEVMDSLDSGCPRLRKMAEDEGPRAVEHYERSKEIAMQLLPAA